MYTICFQSSKCSQHDTLQPLRPGLISKSNWDRCRKITAPQAMKFPGCLPHLIRVVFLIKAWCQWGYVQVCQWA
jgi:hypothetical protein